MNKKLATAAVAVVAAAGMAASSAEAAPSAPSAVQAPAAVIAPAAPGAAAAYPGTVPTTCRVSVHRAFRGKRKPRKRPFVVHYKVSAGTGNPTGTVRVRVRRHHSSRAFVAPAPEGYRRVGRRRVRSVTMTYTPGANSVYTPCRT